MNYIAIIPARYKSTRFLGKPLKMLGNKTIIQHVYENVVSVFPNTWVATDDERIAEKVKEFGGRVVITNSEHLSGTDRCAEAADIISRDFDFDIVVNVQGDEPFVGKEQLNAIKSCFNDKTTDIATLAKKIEDKETLFNPNRPKVIFDSNMNAMLFSRATIPYIRECETDEWLMKYDFFSHIGLYAYRKLTLSKIVKLKPSSLEIAESLEQLRWLENGLRIKVAKTKFETIGIDTPEDLEKAKIYLKSLDEAN